MSQAVHALARMPSPIVSSNLAKTVLVTNYFYRIRMEAALALVAVSASALMQDKRFLTIESSLPRVLWTI